MRDFEVHKLVIKMYSEWLFSVLFLFHYSIMTCVSDRISLIMNVMKILITVFLFLVERRLYPCIGLTLTRREFLSVNKIICSPAIALTLCNYSVVYGAHMPAFICKSKYMVTEIHEEPKVGKSQCSAEMPWYLFISLFISHFTVPNCAEY